jgi:hypothetical protein
VKPTRRATALISHVKSSRRAAHLTARKKTLAQALRKSMQETTGSCFMVDWGPLSTMNGNSHRFPSVESPAFATSNYVDASPAGSLFNSTSEFSPLPFSRPSAPTWNGVSTSSLPLENSSHENSSHENSVKVRSSPEPNSSAPQSPMDLQIFVTDPQVCQEPGAAVMPGAHPEFCMI